MPTACDARLLIRFARTDDAAAIARIYRPFVEQSMVSFELIAPSAEEMAARIAKGGDRFPFLVVEGAEGVPVAYACASAFRERAAYRFAVETSIYVDPAFHGRGIGTRLYGTLLDLLRAQGFAYAVGAIALPNPASVALHRALGFEPSGTYRDIGYKNGAWASVGLFQCALNAMTAAPREPLTLPDCAAARAIPR